MTGIPDYAPFKTVTKRHCEGIYIKDSVRDSLNKGDYDCDNAYKWLTSTKAAYQGKPVEEKVKITQSRDSKSLALGFDRASYLITSQDFKSHSGYEKPARMHAEQKTHIADFCPQYTEIKDPGNSEYQSSYEQENSMPIGKTRAERLKHTNDLRQTHFNLGDFSNEKTSETRHSFGSGFGDLGMHMEERPNSLEIYKSKVFRPGDWNQTGRSLLKTGVTQNDFRFRGDDAYKINDYSSSDTMDQLNTHFNLGSSHTKNNSVYQNDFSLSSKVQSIIDNRALRPPSAHLFTDCNNRDFVTTQKANYENKTQDLVIAMKRDRLAQLEEIRNRHKASSVPVSCYNKESLSITSSDFHEPVGFLVHKPMKPFTSKYNHFTGHYDAHIRSEAKDNFKQHDVSKTLRNECETRQRDNKSTHFVFGTDVTRDKLSEQGSQYRQHLPFDPSLRAAGTNLPQRKSYSHVHPVMHSKLDSFAKQERHMSVMKNDFKYKDTLLTNPGTNIDAKPTTHSVDTHFFHLDSTGNNRSTTQTDFVKPFSTHYNFSVNTTV